MRQSSATTERLLTAASILAVVVLCCGSGCATTRLGRLAATKASPPLPSLEVETESTVPASGLVAGESAESDANSSIDSHIPDSVKLTELLQRVASEPKQAKWQLELAKQYLVMDQPLLAEQAAMKAVALDQQCGEAWVLRGELSERREDWVSALRCYQQALSAQGEQAEWQSRVARCYEQLGEQRRALSALERAEQLYPAGQTPSELKVRRSRLLAELRQYRRAIAELQEVLEEPTQDATPWLVMSEIQVLAGDTSGARLTLAKAKELFPADAVLAQHQQPLPNPRDEPLAIAR
ncbi:MAG: tetratricopeptide repeat protein [Planctomycetota bacterium]